MLKERIAALSPSQRIILGHRLAALQADAAPTSGDRLVAHVVFREGHVRSTETLRQHAAARLPAHMVPDAFQVWPHLPTTPNGKVDRKLLATIPQEGTRSEGPAVMPRNETEQALAEIFQSILECPEVGVCDDFFELGGHSLHVIRAVSRIRESLSPQFRVPDFFSLRTVELLARHLSGQSPTDAPPLEAPEAHEEPTPEAKQADAEPDTPGSALVPIHTEGTRPPIFLAHGAMGMMTEAPRLSELLGPDQPFYALCADWELGKGPATFEEMARLHTLEIVRACPEGPYVLLGYCYGGNVAFEIARQLHAQGRPIAFLGIIEAYPRRLPEYPARSPRALGNILRNVTRKGLALRHQTATETRETARRLSWRLRAKLLKGLDAAAMPPEYVAGFIDMSGVPEEQVRIRDERIDLLLRYKEEPYPEKATLFRAKEQPGFSILGRDLGWSPLASIDIRYVVGKHADMLKEPHIIALVDALKEKLYHGD